MRLQKQQVRSKAYVPKVDYMQLPWRGRLLFGSIAELHNMHLSDFIKVVAADAGLSVEDWIAKEKAEWLDN